MAFGFSVGDVIAGTNLLITSINAVKDSTGASSEYRAVTATLRQTCAALEGLNDLRLTEPAHREALEVAAGQCGTTIFQFVNKISKFKSSLDKEKGVKNWKAVLRKLEWSLYSKEDVRRFQAQLQGDLLALQTTLGRVQLAVTLTGLQEAQSALIRVETRLDQAAATRLLIMRALSRCFEEFRGLLLFVFYSNMRIINALLSSPERTSHVQEERPIYLDDPHGRLIPIPRLWIEDWQDFEDLLKIQFRRVPGLQKILSRQYLLKDAASSAEISRLAAIDDVFVPGRKIIMSVVFNTRPQSRFIRCPKCFQSDKSIANANSEPQCVACGIIYSTRRLTQEESNTEKHIAKAVFPIRRFGGWLASAKKSSAHSVSIASELKYKEKGVMQRNITQFTNAPRRLLPAEYVEDFSRIHIVEVPLKRMGHLTSEWIDKLNNLYIDPLLPRDEGDDSVMQRLRLYDTSEDINTQRLLENVLWLDLDHGLVHAKREFSRSFVASSLHNLWSYLARLTDNHHSLRQEIDDFATNSYGNARKQATDMGLKEVSRTLRLIKSHMRSINAFYDRSLSVHRALNDLRIDLQVGTIILSDIFGMPIQSLDTTKVY